MIEEVSPAIEARAGDLGFDPGALTIAPVISWGGFVNQSLRVSDGRRAVCVKLAREADSVAELERWRRLARALEERYHAPRMLGWVDAAGWSLGGPAFEWIDGTVPASLDDPSVLGAADMLPTLHDDDALAAALTGLGDQPSSCAEAYRRSYHERLVSDLESVDGDAAPFAGAGLIDWLRNEAVELEAEVARMAAFAEPADRPVHADLWRNNLLVTEDRCWYVLDWDGVSLGDPALDWAVDHLADWVQAAAEPFHGDAIRAANRRIHAEALAAYRQRYAHG